MIDRASRRPGAAAIWALLVLAAVSALSAATIGQVAIARRQVDAYQNQIQAEWLARSGYELAVARILADPGYVGETVTPIKGAEVKIVVRKQAGENGPYVVESEARYSAGERHTVVRSVRQAVKRIVSADGVRVEPVSS